MPELLPSCLRPSDKGANLSATKGMSVEAKAAKYDSLRPGVPIGSDQKAERIDRMRFRDENGIVSRRRQTTVGSVRFNVESSAWDENGKLKP